MTPRSGAYWRWLGSALVLLSLSFADQAFAQPEPSPPPPPSQPERSTPSAPSGTESSSDAADSALLRIKAAESVAQLEGKIIRGISVEPSGTRWRDKPKIRSVKVGDELHGYTARKALRELLATGRYAEAYASARPYDDGAILHLLVVPRRIVADVRICSTTEEADSGCDTPVLSRAKILAAADVGQGSELTEAAFGEIKGKIVQLYRRHGYDRPRLRLRTQDTDDPLRVVLLINIKPGQVRTISRRIFVIEPAYDAVLDPQLKHGYAVETGAELDEDKLAEADNELAEQLLNAGFLRVNVSHAVLRRGRETFLYIYLDTGPLYRYRFRGQTAFDDSELLAALNLAQSPDADPSELAGRIRRYYQLRGFYDAEVTATAAGGPRDAVVELRFQIEEGFPVKVKQRLFACLPENAEDGLSADDLGGEIDGILQQELPDVSFIHAVDATLADSILSSDGGGSRVPARRLRPALTYTPQAYDRALSHLRKLLTSKGYMNAVIGPVSLIRAECDQTARGGVCEELPLPSLPPPRCRVDALDLPIAEPPLDQRYTCTPDPQRSILCSPALTLYIPVQLGPRTQLWDIVFEGNETVSSQKLLELAELPLGGDFSNLEHEAAARRLHRYYLQEGYAYASVATAVDYSPDRTRARARFIINEHKPVIISGYEVHGATRTSEDLILGRLALCQDPQRCQKENKYYKSELVRESEENIARLGTFSSVSISLQDPEIPQEHKRVIITVAEQPSQYIEPRGGFSTGEGFRAAFEYGHRNIAGEAISLTLRLEFTLLPEFLILDEDVAKNYKDFTLSERLERRNSGTLRLPEIGLGPKVDLTVAAIDLRDNQRDFGLTRQALVPTLSYRPMMEVSLQLGASVELNDVTLFGAEDVMAAIKAQPSLASILRVPDGRTVAISQRLATTWDRRDNPLAATEGTLLTTALEHVSAFPMDDQTEITSEFLRLTARAAGYVRLSDNGMALALSISGGIAIQLDPDSKTYPDRLFYLGGVNSVRGFQLDAMVPEDLAESVLKGEIGSIDEVGVRGGDLMLNPRVELRIPLTEELGLGIFVDAGNLWADKGAIEAFEDLLKLRYTIGGGLRVSTPIGPIAFDYGFKTVRRQWEDLGALHFSIGLF